MATRYYRLTLSRPGLKEGYNIPLRLRVVDTITILSGIPIIFATLGIGMVSLNWATPFGLGPIWENVFAFIAYIFVVISFLSWIMWWIMIALLRFVFVVSGLMTKAESQSYPLKCDKRSVAPWPDSWQYSSEFKSIASKANESIVSSDVRNNW